MPVRQRPAGDFQQQVVLPEAERKRDAEDDGTDDDAAAQLVEVLNQAELVLMGDRPDAARAIPPGLSFFVADDLGAQPVSRPEPWWSPGWR